MLLADELMIGDWVNIYVFPNDEPKGDALFPARINAILGDSEDVECKFALNGEGKVGYASRPAGTCLPIPLTPEILEKNGFTKSEIYEVWKIINDDYELRITPWRVAVIFLDEDGSDKEEFSVPRPKCVNELQRALRCIGLYEFANNIKI